MIGGQDPIGMLEFNAEPARRTIALGGPCRSAHMTGHPVTLLVVVRHYSKSWLTMSEVCCSDMDQQSREW